MNKHQLASTIWESANQMRSKIEANEYKDFILGFIFYKYLSERELELFRKEKLSEEEIKKVDEKDTKYAKHVRETLGYFIAYDNLFSTWLAMGNDFDVTHSLTLIRISTRFTRRYLRRSSILFRPDFQSWEKRPDHRPRQ